MNFLVGKDDIMADKDPKHIFKRQRNLWMRNKGVLIKGICITPSLLKIHLQSNRVSSSHIRSIMNPNDKQDVVLGYALLKEIWSLPPAANNANPNFSATRAALRLYGQFVQHLILLYICINLSLEEQLIQLSTAAHLAFYLYTNGNARTQFMPSQSYIDIMIMIKNVYFCTAKMKVDDPEGKLFIIQLGTDRLETFFGLIRTAVGTDSNVDILQLRSCSSGLAEVAAILAMHPDWDRSPHCLKLPAITKDFDGELSSKVDHINPASWQGCVKVAKINLHTCWLYGRRKAVEVEPEAEAVFEETCRNTLFDIFSPFGQLLMKQRDSEDEFDCSELACEYPAGIEGIETTTLYHTQFTPLMVILRTQWPRKHHGEQHHLKFSSKAESLPSLLSFADT